MAVSDQIIQVLDTLCEKFGIVIDWTSDNVIPYIATLCEKLVSWEIWTSVAWIIIMVVASISAMILTKIFSPKFKDGIKREKYTWDCDWGIATGFAIAGLICLYLGSLIVIGFQIMDIIKCVTFPEMFVFEYVEGLINSAG